MRSIKYGLPPYTEPTSTLISLCMDFIESGERGRSLDTILQLSKICNTRNEKDILAVLKQRHSKRFEGCSLELTVPNRKLCGTRHMIDATAKGVTHGGFRTRHATNAHRARPKVSVITVNRNCADGLEKTINSVLQQNVPDYEIEHIIIDGGSTDGSLSILEKYADRIEYFISEPDSGIYDAMNKGLALARGAILALLNSDDTYRRNAIVSSVKNIEMHRLDISFGAFAYIRSDKIVEVVDGPRDWDESLLIRGVPGGHGTFFVTSDTYDLVGGYRTDLRIAADYDWMIRAYLANRTAKSLPKILMEMSQGGVSFNNTVEMAENKALISRYLGEVDDDRIKRLYSLKYYLNWHGGIIQQQQRAELLEMAEILRGFEPVYSRSLTKTINRNSEGLEVEVPFMKTESEPARLRICVAVSYLNGVAGGAERIAIESANSLSQLGHDVTIICCHGISGEPFYQIDEEINFLDLACKPKSQYYYCLGIQDWDHSWKTIARELGSDDADDIQAWLDDGNMWRTMVFRGFFRANCFDTVISHMPSTYPYVALAMAGEPSPPHHIASLHSSPKHKFYSDMYPANSETERRIRLSTLGMCDKITVIFSDFVNELPTSVRSKSFVVPNFVSSAFLNAETLPAISARKRKIVSVGRLAKEKNHRVLIAAFSRIKDRIGDWELEIYGEGPLRSELEGYCMDCSLDPAKILLGRTEAPRDVYEQAAIFVLPSYFEGFGLALAEAMAVGMSVIGFRGCAGVSSLIEDEVSGLLAERDEDASGLAAAILRLVGDAELRERLGSNAVKTAHRYTLGEHVRALADLTEKRAGIRCGAYGRKPATKAGLSVALMSTYPFGGAGIAASRLQGGLQKIGVQAGMFALSKGVYEPSFEIESDESDPALDVNNWSISATHNLRSPGATIFASELGCVKRSHIRPALAYDIVNLHWVSHFLSPSSVSFILSNGKPLIWTLHDMLPFTGGCHYACGCEGFASECSNCPQVINSFNDHPNKVIELKKRLWEDRIVVVSPSVWLARMARESVVFRNSRIEVIPNGLDTSEFQAWDRLRARRILGLPADKKIILFACQSHAERRKGFHEAQILLSLFRDEVNDYHLVTVGNSDGEANDLGIPNTAFGHINSSYTLSLIYSACNVTLLPSLEDNLPNIILESLSCGTPVAGFRTGGIVDSVKDGITGYLAPTNDIVSLRSAVRRCIESELREECREYALRNFDFSHQAHAYNELFHSMADPDGGRKRHP